MENLEPITLDLNLRGLNFAFVRDIPGKTATKRCICIPLDDNFANDTSRVLNAGTKDERIIRETTVRLQLWPVSDEAKADYQAKYGREKLNDYDVKLYIGKEAREALAQRDPQTAAALDRQNPAYSKELTKQVFPYCGRAYVNRRPAAPAEPVPTTAPVIQDGDDDLPF